jgi:hypothetical protein
MLDKAIFGIIVLFSINVVLFMFGVADYEWAESMNIIDKSPADYENYTNDTAIEIEATNETSGASDNINLIQMGADSSDTYSAFSKLKFYIGVLVVGYSSVLYAIGLPPLLIFLLTGIVGFFQAYCLYLIGVQIIQALGSLFRLF